MLKRMLDMDKTHKIMQDNLAEALKRNLNELGQEEL